MYLFTIENLCLAAEVTIVLLLLAFAWRPGKIHEKNGEIEPANTTTWEPAKVAYQLSCLYRGLYFSQWSSQHSSSRTTPFEVSRHEDEAEIVGLPEPWTDKLTHLHNRCALDSILDAWLAIDCSVRGQSCLSMLTLNTYSELISSHGAMTTECALRAIAKHLSVEIGKTTIVARYQPDRFVALHFGSSVSLCHASMEHVRSSIDAPGFFEFAENPIPIPCIISILSLEGKSDVADALEQLESGYLYAEEHGVTVVSESSQGWLDKVEIDHSSPAPKSIHATEADKLDSQDPPTSTSNKMDTEDDVAEPTNEPASKNSPSDDAVADKHVTSNEQTDSSSTDVSAVASPDDIAALFAQINSKKGSNSSVAKTTGSNLDPSDSSPANAPNAAQPLVAQTASTEPAQETSLKEIASQDDIAALFATTKQAETKTSAAPNTESAVPTTESAPIVNLHEVDLHEAATPDDIASLFATIKPVARPQSIDAQPVASKSTDSKDTNTRAIDDSAVACAPAKPSTPALETANLAESASPDDIAALFAAMSPATPAATPQAATPAAPPPAAQSISSQAIEPKPATPPIDLDGSATADDIAALFATIKPNTKAPAVDTPRTSSPPNPPSTTVSSDSSAELVTADDIASLFETVQSAIQAESKPSNEPSPLSLPTGDELGEVASPDDIEALFAAMKK